MHIGMSSLVVAVLGVYAYCGECAFAISRTDFPTIKLNKNRFGINNLPLLKSNPQWIRSAHSFSRELDQGRSRAALPSVTPIFRQGSTDQKCIALTFDDGPHQAYTDQLLTVLRKNSVQATFFVVGSMVQKSPDLLQAIVEARHEVGNHSFSHVDLTRVSMFDRIVEYRATADLVRSLTGKEIRLCRPPGGEMNPEVVSAGLRCGLTTVTWTCDPGDFSKINERALIARMRQKLEPGAVYLLHSGSKQTLAILPEFIQYCRSRGYRFATISEMMRQRRAH
jgi:peptidoglycan/xylan/chitin deacetylase (PgdA/CDA1 family)